MLCQMSKYLVNVFVHLLEHLSFSLRCPNFLLSKFATQLKLIQSVVWLGIQVTASQVQLSGSCSQYSGSQGCNFQVAGTHFQGPGCQNPVSQGPRVKGLGSQVLGSQVLIFLDYAYKSRSVIILTIDNKLSFDNHVKKIYSKSKSKD